MTALNGPGPGIDHDETCPMTTASAVTRKYGIDFKAATPVADHREHEQRPGTATSYRQEPQGTTGLGRRRTIQRPLIMSLTYARPSRTTTPQVIVPLGTTPFAADGRMSAMTLPCALRSPRSSPLTSSTWNPALYAPMYSVSPSAHTLCTPPNSGSYHATGFGFSMSVTSTTCSRP